MNHTFISILVFAISMTSLFACDEPPPPPPPPPNLPSITSAELLCELEQGKHVLSAVTFTVKDNDGADTLLDPYTELLSLDLTFTKENLMNMDEASEDEEGTKCKVESCEARYSWTKSAEDYPVLCGDQGQELSMLIRVMDEDGHSVSANVLSTTP